MDAREMLRITLTNAGASPEYADELLDAFADAVRRAETERCMDACAAAARLWPGDQGKPALDALDYIRAGRLK